MAEARNEPTIDQLFDLTGRVALISGATGHLGSAMARALAEAGASVVVSSRKLYAAREFASTLPSRNGTSHHGVQIDQLDDKSIETGFAQALDAAGKIDILINNGHSLLARDWKTVTGQQFTEQLSNATGYFLLSRMLRDHAVSRSSAASIIMIGSMYGLVGSYPKVYEGADVASTVAYHALKGGIIQMTRHLAVYWAEDRVRVNCISPGPFPREPIQPHLLQRLPERVPMQRLGQPYELKGAVVYLASDASSYVTGQNLVIDGGWTAW